MTQMNMHQQMMQQMVASAERAAKDETARIESEYAKMMGDLEQRLQMASSQFQSVQANLFVEMTKVKEQKTRQLEETQRRLAAFLPPGALPPGALPPGASRPTAVFGMDGSQPNPFAPPKSLAPPTTQGNFSAPLTGQSNFSTPTGQSNFSAPTAQASFTAPPMGQPNFAAPSQATFAAPAQSPPVSALATTKVPKYRRSIVFEGWCQQALGLRPEVVVATGIEVLCQHLAKAQKPIPEMLWNAMEPDFQERFHQLDRTTPRDQLRHSLERIHPVQIRRHRRRRSSERISRMRPILLPGLIP
jgi:hypothetical protein